ncbi:hypothetical protein B0H11DRAFT_1938143 [Mycena galericulata]|nr:hypothetical protein B0H11DRAFT_1938143 [Mycena galericulata]
MRALPTRRVERRAVAVKQRGRRHRQRSHREGPGMDSEEEGEPNKPIVDEPMAMNSGAPNTHCRSENKVPAMSLGAQRVRLEPSEAGGAHRIKKVLARNRGGGSESATSITGSAVSRRRMDDVEEGRSSHGSVVRDRRNVTRDESTTRDFLVQGSHESQNGWEFPFWDGWKPCTRTKREHSHLTKLAQLKNTATTHIGMARNNILIRA